MKPFHIGTVLLIALLAVSCGQEESGWQGTVEVLDGVTVVNNPNQGIWDTDEEPKIKLVKELTIGALEEGPDEYLFVYITDVAVNSKGEVYVADRQLNEVRKFDKKGNYLMTLGRQGKGPGEFQSVSRISVNERDELLAFDRMMGRLSVFSDEGKLLQTTKKLIADSWISVKDIFTWDDQYLIFGKLGSNLKLFHKFDKNWKYVESFINYPVVLNKEYEELFLGFNLGNCMLRKEKQIYYTTYLFDNKIRVFNENKLVELIQRQSPTKKPYKVERFTDRDKMRKVSKQKDYSFRTYGQGVFFTGEHYQVSIGLFRLNNGHIVNFVRWNKEKDKPEFGVELYDPNGRLLSCSQLEDIHLMEILCKDAADCFYGINRKDFHKVVKFRLVY